MLAVVLTIMLMSYATAFSRSIRLLGGSRTNSSVRRWLSLSESLHTVHRQVTVNPSERATFLSSTIDSAKDSVSKKDVSRHDVLQAIEDENNFLLIEVYKNENYAPKLQTNVASETSTRYRTLFPHTINGRPCRGLSVFEVFLR